MAHVVYRYTVVVTYEPVIPMPVGARVLSCAPARDGSAWNLDVWALVDPAVEDLVVRRFRVPATGGPFEEEPGRFVGTFALAEGRFIGHLFDLDG